MSTSGKSMPENNMPENSAAVDASVIDELVSVRDWLRFAVSKFIGAKLVYGHGTANAFDEAAFLVLHTLSLPIDSLEPWLDARLTRAERVQVLEVIEKRIASRLPAPYIAGEAWIGPYRFVVDERVIVPRSYIGELLVEGLPGLVDEPEAVSRVLDLCTGSGCLAILAAQLFPNAKIDAVDLSKDALDVATDNVAAYGLEDTVTLVQSDLFAQLAGQRYDLIIANPPYVTDASVAAFPTEFASEPVMAHAGGKDGLVLVRRIVDEALSYLSDFGSVIVEVGETDGRLEEAYPELPFFWLDTRESQDEVFSLTASALRGRKT